MSADFWASYASGAAGLLIGNPLDVIKVRLQAGAAHPPYRFPSARSLVRGTAAPVLTSGALNAVLFVSYNRTSDLLRGSSPASLGTAWTAGAIGGLATWAVSAPTEVVKCQTQMQVGGGNSLGIARAIVRREGVRGLYFGGAVTALRDSVGYGFYFWAYEVGTRGLGAWMRERGMDSRGQEAARVLVCGGLAGVVTWASVFPLDVIKTRVQTQMGGTRLAGTGVGIDGEHRRLGAVEIARSAYKNEGAGVFFRGLGVCSVRAFFVNAVQWAVYELIMRELSPKGVQAPADVLI